MSDIASIDRRTMALQRVARTGGRESTEAKKILAAESAADARKAKADKLAVLPASLAEARGDSRAFAKADMKRQAAAMKGEAVPASAGAAASRASMERELRKRGLEPVAR